MNKKKTPTPIEGTLVSENEIPKKIFSEPTVLAPVKRPNNFQKGKKGPKPPKILPAHREVFQLYKDQGFKSLGKAIRRTGVYSEHVAKRVNVITKSKSWQLLMQEYLPESTIAIRHAELLDKRDWRKEETVDEDGKKQVHYVDEGPETLAVSKGLELAYRLRGAFSKEEAPPASTVMYNLFYKPEVREQIKAFEDGLKVTLFNEINKKNAEEAATEAENSANLADTGAESPSDGGGSSPVKGGISGSANLNT